MSKMRWIIPVASVCASISLKAQAQEWTLSPEIYARGGTTYKSDFSRELGQADAVKRFNNGPYFEESLLAVPLTEITLHAAYGDQFRYHLGVDVSGNRRFLSKDDQANTQKAPLTERVNYLEFSVLPTLTLWYGQRPFRSEPEFLSRAFFFDEINLQGGGLRWENLGPLNMDLAYGSFENDYQVDNVNVQEHTNVVIHKLEYPLEKGRIKSNLEIQQTKRNSASGIGEASTHGLILGAQWQRWGDEVLGGQLYQNFVIQRSSGYLAKTMMSSAFNTFDHEKAASKWLLAWNGDWKAQNYGLYWVNTYQAHQGQSENYSDAQMQWTTLDTIVRPLYLLNSHVNLGVEWARRLVLKEGEAVRQSYDWAAQSGSSRLGALAQYTLENKNLSLPTLGVMVGQAHHEKPIRYFQASPEARTTHFVHFFYEVRVQ